jgi:hypothetical protein
MQSVFLHGPKTNTKVILGILNDIIEEQQLKNSTLLFKKTLENRKTGFESKQIKNSQIALSRIFLNNEHPKIFSMIFDVDF